MTAPRDLEIPNIQIDSKLIFPVIITIKLRHAEPSSASQALIKSREEENILFIKCIIFVSFLQGNLPLIFILLHHIIKGKLI